MQRSQPRPKRRFHLTGAMAAALLFSVASGEPVTAQQDDAPELQPIVVGTPERVEVFPAQVSLATPRRNMHLVVSGFYGEEAVQDLTRAAEFISSDPSVITVEDSMVRPVANGSAQVLVRVGGHEVSVRVEVSGQQQPEPVSFHYGTLVALSKQGCNAGACHGSPSGKSGFRLSLRAYDPAVDIETLVREAYNRRTNRYDPESSLLLKKPTMQVPHGGGRRLNKGDLSYELLRDWIAGGSQVDPPDSPHCEKIEVFPERRILMNPAHTQQLVILAHFSDGSVRDITPLAVFTSSDEAVATVDEQGFVVGSGRGETAILVRYLEKMETSHLMFLADVENFEWNDPAEHNYVDRFVFSKLDQLKILPSDICSDEEFLRRVYLDVIGLLPTVGEVETFLADTDPNRRASLIDTLLERPEYADLWALRWGDLLRLNKKKVTTAGVHKLYNWLHAAVRDDMAYDRFVRELLTAGGSTFDNPPANYYRTAADTNDCTETTSQLFLGIRIQCAKCHNHPFERWTQDNYYGIGAFFTRVQRKPSPRNEELVVWAARSGEITQPRTGQQMKPWLPLTGDAEVPPGVDRREVLVDWLTGPDNPFFAKAEVNRTWGYLMGRGIVEPVDDFRASNPSSNDELLDALAEDFIKNGFDRKHVIRTILKSRTYQLSSRKNEFNKDDVKYFSHARTRLLPAEQLLDAICQVTGVEEKYEGLPSGTRATQLPSPDVQNEFLKIFGQPAREMACECERGDESNLSQALQMINGPLVHGKLTHAENRLRKRAAEGKSDAEIIHELYLSAFARPPSEEELGVATGHIASQPDRIQALEDVCWAVLNAKEFLFQH